MFLNRLLSCVATLLMPLALWADEYIVGLNDRLLVQIAVWDEVNTAVADMPGVSGSYPVGSGGTIALPLAGSIPAADRNLDAVAADIEEALAAYLGIGQSAGAAVSVENYAPIYISGEVMAPGVYDFTPGLTVQQALVMAGDAGALNPIDGQERNFLTARGTIGVLQQELIFLTAKRDRLLAEMEGTTVSVDSPESATAGWLAEDAILAARNARYDHELQSIARSKATLEEATAVLRDKLENNRTQLAAGQAELDREEDLVERGLVASVRVFERASYVNELESRILDIERTIVLAQQDIQELERTEGVLLAVRNEDNATKLQEVEAKIATTEAQLHSQYDLLSAAAGQQMAQMVGTNPLSAELSVTITRTRGGYTSFPADEQTMMMPGDVVTVTHLTPSTTPSN